MAWPHPVVGVAAVLAHAFGGRSHEAHVVVVAIREDVELVAVVHGLHVVAERGIRLHVLGLDGLELFGDGCGALAFGHLVVHLCKDALGHVIDPDEEADVEIFDVHFLVLRFGPKAVREVVVFRRAEALDGAVCTVVVGQHQALRGDDLRGAAAAVQTHDGVLQRSVVDVVNVLGAQAQSCFLHGCFVDALQHVHQPHAFVGAGLREQEHQHGSKRGESFHVRGCRVLFKVSARWRGRQTNRWCQCLARCA